MLIVRALAVGAALGCVAAAPSALAAGEYQIIHTETSTVANGLVRTESTVQVGADPLDRFQMVRVVKDIPTQALHGTLLLLPPISAGFANYEVGDDGDYLRSFAGYFAERGYDVWGLSQRTEGLFAGTCESGSADCSAMGAWGMQTLLDDASFVRAQIGAVHPGQKPVVGGISLGSMAGIAMIDTHPDDYAGALLLEGAIYDVDPADRAIAAQFCAQFEGALAAGVYYEGQALTGLKLIAGLATDDPQGLSPIPGLPPGFTNHQAFVAAMSNPGIGPITPRPGYAMLAGDPFQDRFFFANDALARANIARFSDYMSIRMVRDIDCSLAGDTTWTAALSHFHGPVFVNAGGHGFGPALLDTVALMKNARPTINFVEPFGHMDHYFAFDHRQLTEKPILLWLHDEVFGE
jgi:pimeloyl-ACP methyl ester carboxylesterase